MKKAVIVCLCAASFQACQHEPAYDGTANNNTPTITVGCDADSVYFVNTVQPILISNCTTTKCHDANSPADGVNLTTYSSTIKTTDVRPGSHSQSELYEVLVDDGDDRMPPSGPLSSADIAAIAKWIDQGAKNNQCTESTCITDNVTFSADVMPVINSYCTGCHSGSNPSGNTLLTNYTTVTASATAGTLMGTIKHTSGYPVMPPSGSLSDCQIAKIETWINDGKPNN